jgi:hypothetical protein
LAIYQDRQIRSIADQWMVVRTPRALWRETLAEPSTRNDTQTSNLWFVTAWEAFMLSKLVKRHLLFTDEVGSLGDNFQPAPPFETEPS